MIAIMFPFTLSPRALTSGPIPPELGSLESLRTLQLPENQLSGEFGDEQSGI